MTSFGIPAANKQELIERILEQRASLEALLSPLTVEQATEPLAPGGWSVKDHIAHLTAWAGKAIAALQDAPVYQGLGLIRPPADPRDYEAINVVLHDRDKYLSLEDVVEAFGRRHSELLGALMLASEMDLRRPADEGEIDGRTVLAVVAANTYEHSIEHEGWIREKLAP
ncbi:MAG TPA: DinB family protein [Dehalococcoidia bacterium]|nr:DinB family protein [Dehalococcoidia bacterium]